MKNFAALLLVTIIATSACEQDSTARARKHVASLLRRQLGDDADPRIAFVRDSTHLLVDLSTAAFPTLADSTLRKWATGFAVTALKNYEMGDSVDSVTVTYSERLRHKGGGWIRHIDTFPVSVLRDM
jgi:hypothetical protein